MKRTILLSIPIIVLCLSSFWLRPLNDDFCSMRNGELGLIQGSVTTYVSWSGRYSATAAELMLRGKAPFLAPILLCVFFLGLTSLVNRVLRNWKLSISGAMLLVLTVIAVAPALYESTLWVQGATTYLIALVAYTSVFALDVLPLSIGAAFIAAGFSDVGALLGTGVLLCALAVTRARRWLYAALASGLGLALVIAAPGNANRLATVAHPQIGTALKLSLGTFRYFFHLGNTWLMMLALCVIAYLVGKQGERRDLPRYWVLYPIAALAFAALAWFVGFYTTGQLLTGRAWIVPQFVMLLGLALWAYHLGAYRPHKHALAHVGLLICAAIIWCGALVNVMHAQSFLRWYAARYDVGQALDGADAWVVDCAKGYYPVQIIRN